MHPEKVVAGQDAEFLGRVRSAESEHHSLSPAIGQAIGRWGNFFNEEAFGTPTSRPLTFRILRPPGGMSSKTPPTWK